MGVERAWDFLKKRGIEGTPVDTKASASQIHVDFLSIFRAYLLATEYFILKDLFWKRTRAMRSPYQDADILNDEYLDETRAKRLYTRLHNRLLHYFRQSNVLIHIDGAPSKQKAHARLQRQEKQDVASTKLQHSLEKVNDLLEQVSQADSVARSRKDKIVREARTVQQLWKPARTIDGNMKKELAQELESLGWKVCRCDGEADLCIAGQHGPITVATTDSDFLFHGVDTIFRQDPQNKSSFREFSVPGILDALDIEQEAWTAVGVVSGNDYCKNIPEYGVFTNFKAIQPIPVAETSGPWEILDNYCSQISEMTGKSYKCSMFQRAFDVFFDCHEDLEDNPVESTVFDYDIMDTLTAVEQVLQQYKKSRRPSEAASSTPIVDTDVHMTSAQGDVSDGTQEDASDGTQEGSSDGMQIDDAEESTLTGAPPPRPRPHKRLMPNNVYTAKPYTKTAETTPGSTTVVPRKKVARKKKKKPPKAALASCSRESRKDPLSQKAPSRKNTRKPMTIVQDKLSEKYMTISMDCGTLSRRVKEGLETNFPDLDTSDRSAIAKAVISTIREMVYIGTEATRMIFQAIACYVAKIMTDYPTTEEADSNERKEAFRQFDFFENNAFFANLMTDLFCWHDQSKRRGKPRADTPANRCVSDIINHYRTILDAAGKAVPLLKRQLGGGLGAFFQQTGQRIADVVQSHYRKSNLELVNRVKQFNEEWFFGDGSSIVDGVDKEKGTSDTYGQVSLFWLLNSRLPPEKQLKWFPESDFTDQSFVISERALLDALLAGRSDDIVKKTFGSLSDDVSEHPGDVAFKLFLCEQVDYAKTVCVVNPTIPADAEFEQRGILPLLNQTEQEFTDQVEAMENGSDAAGAKATFKAYLNTHLEDPSEYKVKIASREQEIACRRNVISGSFSTNGHELQVLAYSITEPKPRPRPKSLLGRTNQTRAKLPDVKEVLMTSEQVESQDLDPESYVIVGIDPGVRKTATATMITSAHPDTYWNLSISQSSQRVASKRYLHGLQRAKKTTYPMSSSLEMNVCDLESTIQPVEPQQAKDSGLLPVWQSLRTSIEKHVISIMHVEEPLREFYSSMMFKIKGRELKQAKTATHRKGIDRLLAQAEDLKQEAGAARTLVIVGDGSFTSRNGTLHQKFISDLKKRAQAQNVLVTCADEFRTSMTCCQCGTVGQLDCRSIKCGNCHQERDRDHNGASNIARAALELIKGAPWPKELTRKEQK
ncbi:hypothetical protein BGX34_001675 [Mortierella sp. NVP85]|nr:hypothetical protein BGX34_001675 [Mortierella sp. NVP85]